MKNKIVVSMVLITLVMVFVVAPVFAARPSNFAIKGGKVYLNLKSAEINTVLQIFAKATKTNIVASDDVTGKVTVTFSGIAPKKGLEAVLRNQGLDWYEDEGTIFVSAERTMRTYFMQYAKASEIVDALKTLLGDGDSVSLNPANNALVVRTKSNNFRRIDKLIKELDIPPKQVIVETKIVEVSLGNDSNLGLDVQYTSPSDVNDLVQTKNLAGLPTDPNAQGIYAQVITQNVEAYLSGLSKISGVNLIASPRISAINHQQASLLIGQKLGYKTAIISDTQTTEEIHFLDTGVELIFTPHINSDGFIRMTVAPKVSDGSIVNGLPQENTTQTNSEILVKDGQTFVIGGLIKDKSTQVDTGVPILSHIPLLGALFRKTEIIIEKRELLVFITPYIVTETMLSNMKTQAEDIQELSDKHKARLIH